MSIVKRFLSNERGATAIEYALITGLVFLAIVTAVTSFGARMNTMYNNISSNMR